MLKKVGAERRAVTEALRKLKISGPEARYDLEYSTAPELSALTGVACQFEGTHYWFSSPILSPRELECIVGRDHKVLDVGAGNGTLIQQLLRLGCKPENLAGIDISKQSAIRIRETGVESVHGTISALGQDREFDRIFLSYFVDRDRDQRGTFEKTAEVLVSGGLVILEGLFPCTLLDSSGVSYGTANVTSGRDADEDIRLVAAEFFRLGLVLLRRIDGERYVYSIDGEEVLPSTTLLFEKRTEAETWREINAKVMGEM